MALLADVTHDADLYVTDGNLLFDAGGQFYMAYDFTLNYIQSGCPPGRLTVSDETCGRWDAAIWIIRGSCTCSRLLRCIDV